MRKILSVVISLVMAFSIVSYAVFADEYEKVPEVVAPDGFPEDAVQLPKDDLEVVSEKEKFIPADLTPEMFRQIFGALETQESIQIYIDKEIVIFPDVKPQIIDGRTLVPVRFIAEQLGAKVDYESVNGKRL